MKFMKYCSLAALLVAVAVAQGCGNKPPQGTKSAVVYDDAPAAKAAEPAAPAESPAPEVSAAPAPAEAPAAGSEFDELDMNSLSGKQDIGLDMPAPAPAPAAAAEAAPAAETAVAPAAAPAAAPAGDAVTYVIEPNDDSAIEFTGYKVTGHKVGAFANFNGTVQVPGGDITQAKIDLTVDLASVFTEAGALTEKLKSADFFDVAKYANARFTSSGIEKTAEGYIVKGDFDLHGVVKPIGFPAEISIEGDTLKANAEFTIDRNVWGVSYAGVTDDLIKPEVLISFSIVAKKQ
jgi:polyisoprenoid-binding protein YceI